MHRRIASILKTGLLFSALLGVGLLSGCDRKESGSESGTSASSASSASTSASGTTGTGASIPGAANASAAAGNTIKIGQFTSLTGSEATWGQSSNNGTMMAVEEINAAGGVNGRLIELITYDTQGKSQETGNAVTRLIKSDKVVALLGEIASGLSLAAGRVAQAENVPMISHASTNIQVTEIGPMIHRICFIDSFQSYAAAKFARENLKAENVAVLYDQALPYSTGLREDFVKAFKEMGGTITTEQAYTNGDQDFGAVLTTIRATNPDAIYLPGYYTDVATIALQVARLGIKVPLIGGDGWESPKLPEIAGKAIEGHYFTNHCAAEDPRPEYQAFIAKYKAKYGSTPDAMASLAYDAVGVLVDAMKRAPSLEGTALASAISATNGYAGVTGTITLDAKRNARKPAVMLQVKDGKFVYAATIDPPSE